MTTEEILDLLARLRVETGSLACLGCGHEHNCGIHGCAILREAAALIEDQTTTIRGLRFRLTGYHMEDSFNRGLLTAESQRRRKAEAERDALREKVPRWISVHGESPKPGTRVLATDGVFVGEAYRTSADTWRRYDGIAMRDCIGSVVTHWIPLPEAPEVNDGKENS